MAWQKGKQAKNKKFSYKFSKTIFHDKFKLPNRKGVQLMNMVKVTTKSGKTFYIPYGNDGKIIKPIFEYLKHMSINGCSKYTIRDNCSRLLIFWQYLEDKGTNYIDFIGGNGSKKKVAYDNLTNYQLYLLYPDMGSNVIPIEGHKQIREESTVNQMMSSVINFYHFLSESGMVEDITFVTQRNVLSHSNSFLREMFINKKKQKKSMFAIKAKEKDPEYITSEEFDRCWDACLTRVSRVIIGLMFSGGLRVSEIVGLRIEDMSDISHNIVHVVKRDDPNNPDAAVKYNSVGDVVVNEKVKQEIIDYMIEDLRGIDTNYLIINFKGPNKYGPMRTNNIREIVDGIGKRAGLNHNIHPHMFRHGCAMNMLIHDIDLFSISTQLRHKNVSTTQIYAKMDIGSLIEAHKKLSEVRAEAFEPLNVDLHEIAKYLLEGDDD